MSVNWREVGEVVAEKRYGGLALLDELENIS